MIKNVVLIFYQVMYCCGKNKKTATKKKTSCCCVPALFVVKWFEKKSVFVVVLQTYMLNATSVAKTILIMSRFFSCLFCIVDCQITCYSYVKHKTQMAFHL